MSMGELIAKQGGGVFGDPEKLRCPHCGGDAKLTEVVTPRKGWVLQFWSPPFGCCPKTQRGAAR